MLVGPHTSLGMSSGKLKSAAKAGKVASRLATSLRKLTPIDRRYSTALKESEQGWQRRARAAYLLFSSKACATRSGKDITSNLHATVCCQHVAVL